MSALVDVYVQLGITEIMPTVTRAESITLNEVFTKTNFDLLRLKGVTTARAIIENFVKETVNHGLKTRWGHVHEVVHKELLRLSGWIVFDPPAKTGTDAIVTRPGKPYYLLNVKSSFFYGNGSEHEGLPAMMAKFRQSSFEVDDRPLKDIPNVELVIGSVSTEGVTVGNHDGVPLRHVFGQSFLKLFEIEAETVCFDMEEVFERIEEHLGEYSFINRVNDSIQRATARLFNELMDNNGIWRGTKVIRDHDHIDINAVRSARLATPMVRRKRRRRQGAVDLFSYSG